MRLFTGGLGDFTGSNRKILRHIEPGRIVISMVLFSFLSEHNQWTTFIAPLAGMFSPRSGAQTRDVLKMIITQA